MHRFPQLARGWDAEALRLYPLPSNASLAPGALLSPRIALYSAVARPCTRPRVPVSTRLYG